MSNSPSSPATFVPLVAFRRHALKMLLVFLVVISATLAYTGLSTPLYTSEAKVFVRLGRESVSIDPTATTGHTVQLQESRENEINSIYELLKSRRILEQVVDTMGSHVILGKEEYEIDNTETQPTVWTQINPLASYSARDKAIRRLSKRFRVDVVRKSNIINVSCEATSPELAQEIVENALKFAADIHLRVNRTTGSYEFFATQAERQVADLHQHEEELRAMKNTTGIASLEAQRQVHVERIADIEDRRLKNQCSLQTALAEAGERRLALSALPETHVTAETTGHPQTAATQMREQLYALELKEKEFVSRYQENTFFVKQIREQLAAAREVLANEEEPTEVTKSLNSAHQAMHSSLLNVQATVSGLKAEAAALDLQLAEAKRSLETFNQHESQIVRLERQIELEKGTYKRYSENLEIARIDRALEENDISNLNVLQAPTRSVTPTNPRVIVNLCLGFVLATFASVAVATLSELRRTPVANTEVDQWFTIPTEVTVSGIRTIHRSHAVSV